MALVEAAAGSGDAEATFMLANWRLFGLYGARDIEAAHTLLTRAAEAGHVEAAKLRAYLTGNGTGCPSDPDKAYRLLADVAARDAHAAFQLEVLRTMPPNSRVAGLSATYLSRDPLVYSVEGVLSESECGYLKARAGPALRPSSVIDPRTGGRIPHPVRTSLGMDFGPTEEDLIVQAINRRLAFLTETDVQSGEPLHVLCYSPGQEYKPHMDGLPGAANQRICTVLIYLNDDFTGGETVFPKLDVRFRGCTGDVLVFRNVTADGKPDPRTLHAGQPVISGTKWLATRWIRHGPYSPWE